MDWAEIAGSQALHEYLKRVAAYPQIAAVGLVSPDRVLAASSSAFPLPPTIVSPRTFLPIERPGREPLYISPVSPGSRSGKDQFSLARYKPNSDKTADGGGMIFVSMQPSSFTDYYSSIVNPVDYTVTTALSDGAILVRYPDEALAGRVLSPESGYRRTTAQNPQRGIYDAVSELDGIRRLFAYSKAGSYPVYVTVGLNRSSVIGGWARLMASHLIFGVPATSCLIALAFFALRRSEAADRALAEARVEAERRKAAEESLRHAQRIEAVGRLTGGVAHDFNNLLTAITGNLDMILRRPEEASRVKRLAEAALRGALRGERLTHQLLMFSRRQVMRPETLNLNRLLIEFEGLMRRAAGERIELEMKLDPGLDPSRVDRAQFEAAVLNLIVNARDALTAGGRIIVETHNVTLDEAYAERNAEVMAGSYVLLTVTDNGSGIEKDVLPRVFEPFFTTKEIGKGSGLGLSQVYGFAKESGGHVQIYTEVGHGTTIKLYLPKSVEPAVEPARSELVPLRTAGPSETVLVVEDDEAVLVMAVESLRDLGYRVLVAHGGREALDIVNSSENIDILFSDIVMPGGINGAQLAMEARRLRPSIKVLLTSGYTGAALRSEHGLPPDLPVLGKPYRRDQLAAQLRVIVGGQAR
ncbi:MAG: response regulator [Alphaproteobacteria bacterium]|nr:response regulator [Alphaproteobacteria bacterium]